MGEVALVVSGWRVVNEVLLEVIDSGEQASWLPGWPCQSRGDHRQG